jgi:hypothetical protein
VAINLRKVLPQEGLPSCNKQIQTPSLGNFIEQRKYFGGAHFTRPLFLPYLMPREITVDASEVAAIGKLQTA